MHDEARPKTCVVQALAEKDLGMELDNCDVHRGGEVASLQGVGMSRT